MGSHLVPLEMFWRGMKILLRNCTQSYKVGLPLNQNGRWRPTITCATSRRRNLTNLTTEARLRARPCLRNRLRTIGAQLHVHCDDGSCTDSKKCGLSDGWCNPARAPFACASFLLAAGA